MNSKKSLFSNPITKSIGEYEPFHTHSWKSIFYKVEYADGSGEILIIPSGVYELPPEELYACTNLGASKENCLRFEVKD